MGLIEIFSILVIHWIADFILQTDKQAKGKSKNWRMLLDHTANYSFVWYSVGVFVVCSNLFYPFFEYQDWSLSLFVIFTFMCHTITDYFTSRLSAKFWKEGKTHLFFVTLGFDQILHYVQLFLTYWILTGKN